MEGLNEWRMMNGKRMVISFLLIQTDEGDLERVEERVQRYERGIQNSVN